MKIITIPATVTPKAISGQHGDVKGIPFKEFLGVHLDTYSAAKTPKQFRQIGKIIGILDDAKETISLEDADYELLKATLEEAKYLAGICRQLTGYYDAVDKADDVKK